MNISYRLVGVNKLLRKFTKFNNFVNFELKDLTRDEAEQGASYMVGLMPKQTYAMIQAVSVEPKRDAWAIISRTPKTKGKLRPYHIYYNYGKRGWYKGSKRSGEYHFFEKTVRLMGERFPRKVHEQIKNKLEEN